MADPYTDLLADFDLELLGAHSDGSAIPSKLIKQKKAIHLVKKRIIKTENILKKFYEKKRLVQEIGESLMKSKEVCTQVSLDYRKSLCEIAQLEEQIRTLNILNQELKQQYSDSDIRYNALQAHATQLQSLVEQYETKIDSIHVEKSLEKDNLKKAEKKVSSLEKTNDVLYQHVCTLKDVILGKRKIDKNVKVILQKYKTKNSDSTEFNEVNDSDDLFCNDDIGTIWEHNTASKLENKDEPSQNIPAQCHETFSLNGIEICKPSEISKDKISSHGDETCDADSYSESGYIISSIDSGRGTSHTYSDSEKCLLSPDYFENDNMSPDAMMKTKDTKCSIILEYVETCTSPIIFQSESPEDVENGKAGRKIELISTSTSPIHFVDTHSNSPKLENITRTSTVLVDSATSPIGKFMHQSDMGIIDTESCTNVNNNLEVVQTQDLVKDKGASCCENDSCADLEVRSILDTMRLNYNLVSPLSESPTQNSGSRNSLPSHECQDIETMKQGNKILKINVDNLTKQVLEITSFLKRKFGNSYQNSILENDNTEAETAETTGMQSCIQNVEPSTHLSVNEYSNDSADLSIADIDIACTNPTPVEQPLSDGNVQSKLRRLFGTESDAEDDLIKIPIEENDTIGGSNKNKEKNVKKIKRRKLSKLEKFKGKILPNRKPMRRSERPRNTFKPKLLLKPQHYLMHKTSKVLNDRSVYEKAIAVMAEIRARKEKKSDTIIRRKSKRIKTNAENVDSSKNCDNTINTPTTLNTIECRTSEYDINKKQSGEHVSPQNKFSLSPKSVSPNTNNTPAEIPHNLRSASKSPQPTDKNSPRTSRSYNCLKIRENEMHAESVIPNSDENINKTSTQTERVSEKEEVNKNEHLLDSCGLMVCEAIEKTPVVVLTPLPQYSPYKEKSPTRNANNSPRSRKTSLTSPSTTIITRSWKKINEITDDVSDKPRIDDKRLDSIDENENRILTRSRFNEADRNDTHPINSRKRAGDVLPTCETRRKLRSYYRSTSENDQISSDDHHEELPSNKQTTSSEKSDVPCRRLLMDYSDVNIFNNNTSKTCTPKDTSKNPAENTCHPKDSILCKIIEKYAKNNIKTAPKKVPAEIIDNVCKTLEESMTRIGNLEGSAATEAMDELVNSLKKYTYKHFMHGFLEYLKKPERKTELFKKIIAYPAPPMTKSEQILLYILPKLKSFWPKVDIREETLLNIEYTLFRLNHSPEFYTIESLSHFYALLCRHMNAKTRLRAFMLDAMYCMSFKAVPLIKQCIDVWMHVIPLAHLGMARTPLVTCLVYLLHFYKCQDRYNRVQDIRQILFKKYSYKMADWNENRIVELFHTSLMELPGNKMEMKMLRLAFIILTKRLGSQWCQKNIIQKIILPLIANEKVEERIKHFSISLIGPIMKPYSDEMKVHCEIVINRLFNIMDQGCTPKMKDAILITLVTMSKHNPNRVRNALLSWKPQNISEELESALCSYVREKPLKVWINVILPKCILKIN